MKWFSELFDSIKMNQKGWLNSIVSPAMAILMHNYYKNKMRKEPFNLPPMNCETHPLSYLLILSDELQDWNRMAYGVVDKKRASAKKTILDCDDKGLIITYLTQDDEMGKSYSEDKKRGIEYLLNLESIFDNGLMVYVKTRTDLYIDEIKKTAKIFPRPLIENIESIAKEIHYNYNALQLKQNPNKVLEYPTWETLPQILKYSNVRNAREILGKLHRVYMYVSEEELENRINELDGDEIEFLAEIEHDAWVNERTETGWTYGDKKDVEKKITPYLVSYNELTEEIKEYDRDSVRNMIRLLDNVGLKVYRG